MAKKTGSSFFESLRSGLEECLAHERGELTLKTRIVPDRPPEIDASNLTAMRLATGLSQAMFAKVLNVSSKTLQSWEQGTRTPSMASKRLIHVFSLRPDIVCEVVGLKIDSYPAVTIQAGVSGNSRILVKPKKIKAKTSKP